ncbi:hypothetical protein PP713_13845 [Mycobacterium sp. CSUR Q5927]|nr:hypothetical protein [Mycobacterium sp. CSUR Q5927]
MSELTTRTRELLDAVADDPLLIHLVDANRVVGALADLTAALERVEKLAGGDYCSWMGGTNWISRSALRDAWEGDS